MFLTIIHITLSYAITFVRMPWRKDYISLLTIDFRELELLLANENLAIFLINYHTEG